MLQMKPLPLPAAVAQLCSFAYTHTVKQFSGWKTLILLDASPSLLVRGAVSDGLPQTRLHERGASVAVNVRNRERAKALVKEIGERAFAVPGDVAADGVPDEIARRTLERFGRIDILVNNAALPLSTRFPDLTAEEWRRAIEVNLTAPFLMTKAVLPAMRAQHYGRIINISSSAGRMVSTLGGAHYTASKAGLLGLTRAAAKELGKFGITVNAVCPGMIDTELTREHASDEVLERLAASYPVPRLGTRARSRRFDLFRRLRGRWLHHRRVPRHQRRRLDDVIYGKDEG